MKKNKRRGLGTVELTIGVGIALAVAAGVAKLISVATKSGKIASARVDFNVLADKVGVALRDPATCHTALYNSLSPPSVASFSPTSALSPGTEVAEIRLGPGTLLKKNDIVTNLLISDLTLVETDPTRRTVNATTGRFFTSLTLSAMLAGGLSDRVMQRTYILLVTTNLVAGPTQHNITGCELQTLNRSVASSGGSGYSIIARHSFTTTAPACPAEWDTLWSGYSFAGGATGAENFNMDLGTSGSCLEAFNPLPFITCQQGNGNCDYSDHLELTMWLTTVSADEGSVTDIPNILPKISRCSVCAKASPVLVRHSMTSSVPACPTGWSSLWTGYSLAGTSGHNLPVANYLHSPGSCLETFKPSPVIECNNGYDSDKCEYWTAGDATLWLTGFYDANNVSNMNGATLLNRISRCTVCTITD